MDTCTLSCDDICVQLSVNLSANECFRVQPSLEAHGSILKDKGSIERRNNGGGKMGADECGNNVGRWSGSVGRHRNPLR